MTFQIDTVPCLNDNYAFLLIKDGDAVVIDVPEAAPLLNRIASLGLTVRSVWLTHHHDDHIQGLGALLNGLPDGSAVEVYGALADKHRLPPCDHYLEDGDTFEVAGSNVSVLDVSGHTVGHIAFYVADASAAFTGDSLMALGCGRVFEGTKPQMWNSLQKFTTLPPDTIICSGHEYTAANLKFALTIEPENADLKAREGQIQTARASGTPTVPSMLSDELATNPFLRAHLQVVKDGLGLSQATDEDAFAEIRSRKDRF